MFLYNKIIIVYVNLMQRAVISGHSGLYDKIYTATQNLTKIIKMGIIKVYVAEIDKVRRWRHESIWIKIAQIKMKEKCNYDSTI